MFGKHKKEKKSPNLLGGRLSSDVFIYIFILMVLFFVTHEVAICSA